MKNDDIKTGTRVHHPEGGEYCIQRLSMNGSGGILTLAIGKSATATAVFDGHPDEARKHGFLFGDEVVVEEIEALLTPEEPEPSAMRRAWLASEEAVRALTETIESREADISNLKEELSSAKSGASDFLSRAQRAESNLDSFKVQVRDQVDAARKEHDLCVDGCNSFLEELGLPPLKKRYTVTVTRDSDGETILTVSDIEADSESEAKSEVQDNFTVTATVKEVRFDYEYDGEGEADFDSDDYTDDDFDVTDDEYADSHKDALTFSVEEE